MSEETKEEIKNEKVDEEVTEELTEEALEDIVEEEIKPRFFFQLFQHSANCFITHFKTDHGLLRIRLCRISHT